MVHRTKMGINSSLRRFNYDGAKDFYWEKKIKGLAAMFTMMNYERLMLVYKDWALRNWPQHSAICARAGSGAGANW